MLSVGPVPVDVGDDGGEASCSVAWNTSSAVEAVDSDRHSKHRVLEVEDSPSTVEFVKASDCIEAVVDTSSSVASVVVLVIQDELDSILAVAFVPVAAAVDTSARQWFSPVLRVCDLLPSNDDTSPWLLEGSCLALRVERVFDPLSPARDQSTDPWHSKCLPTGAFHLSQLRFHR